MKVIITLGNMCQNVPMAHEDVLAPKHAGITLSGQAGTNERINYFPVQNAPF